MIRIYYQKNFLAQIFFESFNFPGGEKHVKLKLPPYDRGVAFVEYYFDGNESIIELLLVCDALKRANYKLEYLLMKYCPFAQQDRVMVPGEPLSIKVFADLINSLGFNKVEILDPHSDVTPALLNNCQVVPQWEIFAPVLEKRENPNYYIICPDAGALKKCNKLSHIVHKPVILCEKERDIQTGEIKKTVVHAQFLGDDWDSIIIDDCCVGGKTFIEMAKELRRLGAKKIVLMVTHGIFSKGLDVFDGLIDEIYTKDGKVK